jgi:Zn-dependent peptidase ImmA (M78 family)
MANRVSEARAKAVALLAEYGVTSLPVPVEKIAKARNIAVQFSPFDQELSGMALIKDGVPIIGVNALHHPNRQRFTIAHELGHHVMHRDLIDGTVHIDKGFAMLKRDEEAAQGTNLVEVEANAFASELLMPKQFIDQIVDIASLDIDDEAGMKALAKRFRVSVSAMQNRLSAFA